jgi:transposase
LRSLATAEEQLLGERLAVKRVPAKIYERYRVIALVGDGATAGAASLVVGCSDVTPAHWVKRFNESGSTTFEKQPNRSGRTIIH